MFIFLLLLIAVFLFPYLLFPFFLFFLLLVILLPFKFTFDSILHLLTAPSQIYKIATNKILRKNHGLEHATINILEREYGFYNLAGYAKEDGFYILGADNVWIVEEAARRGLKLMKQGQSWLAVHKRCGTSVTVANLLSAVIFLFLLFSTGYFSIFNVIIAIIAANLLSPILGEFMQKQLTTTADVDEMEIISARFSQNKNWRTQPMRVFVQTKQIPYLRN